jgi:protein-tyrosine-phosphatase
MRALLKRLLPGSLARWRWVLLQLDATDRRALIRWALPGTRRQRNWRRAVAGARRVLFVCHGNIIRSPFGAAVFERAARERGRSVQVSSAGIAARQREPADPRAVQSAAERGFSLAGHASHLFTDEDAEAADIIFVMDLINAGHILGRYPEAAGRVFLLGSLLPDGGTSLREIHDPVTGTLDDVRTAHDEVLRASRLAADALGGR